MQQTEIDGQRNKETRRKERPREKRNKWISNLMYRITDAAFSADKRLMIGAFGKRGSSA